MRRSLIAVFAVLSALALLTLLALLPLRPALALLTTALGSTRRAGCPLLPCSVLLA